MAKSSRGGQGAKRDGGSIAQSTTGATVVISAAPATAQNIKANYQNFTDTDASALIAANSDAYDDPDFTYARKLYVSDATDSAGFSMSQNLNYKLDNGMKLDANEQFMRDMLGLGVRPIGKDTMLFRAAHDDLLKKLGISDYTKMSQAQLQQQLVGTTLQTTSFTSWSYDKSKNPFLPGQPNGGGREVYMVAKAGASTQMFFGAKSQAEVVSNIGTNMRISKVYFDGTYATPRLKSGKVPRIVIEVETW